MDNLQFDANQMNSDEPHQAQSEEVPVEEQHQHSRPQNDFQSAIQTLKENCLRDTEKLSDFKQPFRPPNHGEGHRHDLTMDEIYVHVVDHSFHTEGRYDQLIEYPPDADDILLKYPEDIIDKQIVKVLAVGRPGIGKTLLSTKLLRLWASGEALDVFNVVLLVKFRRFNDNAEMSLRDLLACAETVQSLDDAVWYFIIKEPTKVLLIFDGVDEYSRKEDINAPEDNSTYTNYVEEKMPLFVLYNKLAAGKLLPGASILTTTQPTVKCFDHVRFQKTVEICGFTSEAVKEYVEKFARGVSGAPEKMWEHIKSNINLFTFCYIPMNCFLICHCLLQIILSESSQPLPKKITDIYEMTVKMFFFSHNREGVSQKKLEKLKSKYMYQPFEKFPEELQKICNRLGEIAFKGIQEARLLFESSEVKGLEDCGLLHKLPDVQSKRSLNDPPKSQFCFTHLTVQEFFAAKYLVDTRTDEGIEEFVCKHIDDGTWQVVLQFIAGLLKSSLSSDIFIKLLPQSTQKRANVESSEPETLTFWPATKEDGNLAVQVCKCLYEIHDEQQPILQNKKEKIKFSAVEFIDCSLKPFDVAAILHFLENVEDVLFINLFEHDFQDWGAKEVKKFIVNGERKLKILGLGENDLTDNAVEDLAAALKHNNCNLEMLNLSCNNLTDKAAKDLAAALKHSNCKLKSLRLSHNKLTDEAAKDLAAALKHNNCKLKSLGLSCNQFTDKAAEDLAEALKHSTCKLQSLYLGYNKFTDKAAQDLAAAIKHNNCKLESLGILKSSITRKGFQYLADANKQSNNYCKFLC